MYLCSVVLFSRSLQLKYPLALLSTTCIITTCSSSTYKLYVYTCSGVRRHGVLSQPQRCSPWLEAGQPPAGCWVPPRAENRRLWFCKALGQRRCQLLHAYRHARVHGSAGRACSENTWWCDINVILCVGMLVVTCSLLSCAVGSWFGKQVCSNVRRGLVEHWLSVARIEGA